METAAAISQKVKIAAGGLNNGNSSTCDRMVKQQQNEDPDHVREASETIEALRQQRYNELPPRERAIQQIVESAGRPRTIAAVVVVIALWVVLNLFLANSHHAFDTPTFAYLNLASQLVSLIFVLTILAEQNTQRTIEQERARLILQMAVIADKKLTEILRHVVPEHRAPELREPTDLQQAAGALRKAEEESGAE